MQDRAEDNATGLKRLLEKSKVMVEASKSMSTEPQLSTEPKTGREQREAERSAEEERRNQKRIAREEAKNKKKANKEKKAAEKAQAKRAREEARNAPAKTQPKPVIQADPKPVIQAEPKAPPRTTKELEQEEQQIRDDLNKMVQPITDRMPKPQILEAKIEGMQEQADMFRKRKVQNLNPAIEASDEAKISTKAPRKAPNVLLSEAPKSSHKLSNGARTKEERLQNEKEQLLGQVRGMVQNEVDKVPPSDLDAQLDGLQGQMNKFMKGKQKNPYHRNVGIFTALMIATLIIGVVLAVIGGVFGFGIGALIAIAATTFTLEIIFAAFMGRNAGLARVADAKLAADNNELSLDGETKHVRRPSFDGPPSSPLLSQSFASPTSAGLHLRKQNDSCAVEFKLSQTDMNLDQPLRGFSMGGVES